MATPFNYTLRIKRASGGNVETWNCYATDAAGLVTFKQGGKAAAGDVNRLLLYAGDVILDGISPTPATVTGFTINIDTVSKYTFAFADIAATVQGRWIGVRAEKMCELTITQF